jgi:RNA polymerase sigma factor (sigma-70 family)
MRNRERGFASFFVESRQALTRYVRRLVRSPSAAEEIVQEAFLRTYQVGEVPAPLRPYLFSTARNLASNVRRHDRVVARFCTGDLDAAELSSSGESPEDEVLADERIRLLTEVIGNLPPQRRAAFTLRMFHERSYKEIAAHLGISARTVEKHIAAAVREIHAELAKRYKDVKSP